LHNRLIDLPVSGLKRTLICGRLIPDFYTVLVTTVIVFLYFSFLYGLYSRSIFIHITPAKSRRIFQEE